MKSGEEKFFKIFVATFALVVMLPLAILCSAIIFQGHIHPDEWKDSLLETVVIVTPLIFVYALYLLKVIKD